MHFRTSGFTSYRQISIGIEVFFLFPLIPLQKNYHLIPKTLKRMIFHFRYAVYYYLCGRRRRRRCWRALTRPTDLIRLMRAGLRVGTKDFGP